MKRSHIGDIKHADVGSSKVQNLASFAVWPRNRFERGFPKFCPQEIGQFSLDEKRRFCHDSSRLKFLSLPKTPKTNTTSLSQQPKLCLDLRDGYDIFIQKDESVKEYLDDMLRWLLQNKGKFERMSADRLPMDFVCWRGLLTKILCTPYENREGWKFAAVRFRNCIYLCEYDTQQRVEEKQKLQEDSRQKEMSYWGFKFEQYVTADTEDGVPDTKKPVNNNEAFVSVVRTHLNRHSLVFGGEVDCREGNKYIELKTCRKFTAPNHIKNFQRFKLLKWWAQSFLIGVPRIICGFRDDRGIVESLETYEMSDIPKQCKHLDDCWQGTVCFNFCDDFLTFVKDTVKVDYDRGIYVFEWSPRQPVSCTFEKPDSEYAFLPRWFTEDSRHSYESTSIQARSTAAGTTS